MPSPALFANLSLPLICAPMFLVSGSALVIAALRAGISGGLPSGTFRSTAEFAQALAEIAAARREIGEECPPHAVNLSLNARRRLGEARFEADCAACEAQRVPLIITTSGDPAEIVRRVHGWGGLVFHDVTTIAHACKAAAAGVDGLILVCAGGGGHSGLLSPFAFLPAVRRFFDGVIVLAGAMGTGEAILSAQALGADLCYAGTRFIATTESLAPTAYKRMIAAAGIDDIVYTGAFTRGTPASFLTGSIRAAGLDPADLGQATICPDGPRPWRDIWSAGQSAALIDDVPSLAEVVDRLTDEYDQARARLVAADGKFGRRLLQLP